MTDRAAVSGGAGVASGLIELAAGPAAVTIAPDEGGMLLALRVDGRDLLIPRRDDPGPVPTFGSFLMAPWVGELSEGRLEFRGRSARMPRNRGRHSIHGLVAGGPWLVVDASSTAATLARTLDPPWPFGGTVIQEIRLDPDGITLEVEVRAGDAAMPAAVGWHPWFVCPDPSRVRVGVAAGTMLELDDELLPTGRVLPVTGDADLRDAPALGGRQLDTVFVGADSPARLHLPGLDVQLHFDPEIDVVVVYTSPGAVCVEPWSAWPDAFRMSADHPSGARLLEPGESLRRWTRWAWTSR